MGWFIGLLVVIGTFMQFSLAVVDLRTTRHEAAKWSAAEDDLIAEHPIWRRRGVKRELRSWRSPEMDREIRLLNAALLSWLLLLVASAAAFATAEFPI